ncbi:MAG: hypothetical protein CML39_00075, partial [Rhodobacteraceae bacterium]
MRLNRRKFIVGAATASAALAGLTPFSMAQTVLRPLPILPMTDLIKGVERRISLSLSASTHDFGN